MDVDVVIAGAGPTGLLLAYELGLAGVAALVLDKSPHPDEQPRANGLVGQITRVLAYRGLLEDLPLHPIAVPKFPFGPLSLELDRLDVSPLHVLPVPQHALEDLLHSAATGAGATVHRGHELIDFAQTDNEVVLRVQGPMGEYTLAARYLVGCDGGRSFVRKHAGIAFPGITSDEVSRMARVTMPPGGVAVADGTLAVDGVRLALLRPNRTATGSITIAPQRMLDPAADPDVYILATSEPQPVQVPEHPLTPDELRASVHRVLGTDLPITEVRWARSTVANSRQAEAYRSGRVFLAGDAAHVFSAGGSALNAGLLDAVNLGWKLAVAARGTAPAGLLDTYQAERHPAGRHAILHTRAQAALSVSGENAEALREILGQLLQHPGPLAQLAAVVEGSDVTYGPGPLIGTWAPDTLDEPAATHAVKQLHSGRAIVIDATQRGTLTATADPWQQRLDVVASPHSGASTLIRPDGYVAWAGDTALATLHRLATTHLATGLGPGPGPGPGPGRSFDGYFRAALAFAGYVFWAQLGFEFDDEHYPLGCPHCGARLMIVIGGYGHYAAIRDGWAGDIHRVPLRPADPERLDDIRRWMHRTATRCGQLVLADGLTYLFGDATCSTCESKFNVADWLEAENSPIQPIDPVVPRLDRST